MDVNKLFFLKDETETMCLIQKNIKYINKNYLDILISSIAYKRYHILQYLASLDITAHNETTSGQYQPLELAVINNDLEAILILDQNKKIDYYDQNTASLVYAIIYSSSFDIIHFLINKRIGMQNYKSDEATPLYWSTQIQSNQLCKLLLENGANPNSETKEITGLYQAASDRNYDEMRTLLSFGADVNGIPKAHILDISCYMNYLDVADFLLSHGADINYKDEYGRTAVFWAAIRRDHVVIDFLIQNGAETNYIDYTGIALQDVLNNQSVERKLYSEWYICGDTSMEYPKWNCSKSESYFYLKNENETIKMIMENMGLQDFEFQQKELLFLSVNYRRHNVLQFMLENNWGDTCSESDKILLVNAAIMLNDIVSISILYKMFHSNFDSNFFIHKAVEANASKEVFSFLLKYNTEIDLLNEDSITPLYLAIKNGNSRICSLLLEYGADCNKKCNDDTCIAYSMRHAQYHIVLLLCKYGAKFDNQNTPLLHIAVNVESYQMIDLCLSNGLQVDSEDQNGRTALYWAILNNNKPIADYLIKKGANLLHKDSTGITPKDILNNKILQYMLRKKFRNKRYPIDCIYKY